MANELIALPPRAADQRRKVLSGEAAVGDRNTRSNYLMRGGPRNITTGMGGSGDHTKDTLWEITEFETKDPLETIYTESWAAGNFIDIPVDDMFIHWRSWEETDEKFLEDVEEVELKYGILNKLARAMKAGRIYGSGLLIIATTNSPLNVPLVPEEVKKDDLGNLLVVDRYDCDVIDYNTDLYDTDFNEPVYYEIVFNDDIQQSVHSSRVLRFDGKMPLSITGWQSGYYEQWGVSMLIPAIHAVLQDHMTALMGAHLLQESSIPVLKVQGFDRTNQGIDDPDDPRIGDVLASLSDQKSNYRMLGMGINESLERVEADISGIPELMNQYAHRLAAMANIPATRFLGSPPTGFSATGESDMQNYAIMVKAMQKKMLGPKLYVLDTVMARHLGIDSMPGYEWVSLIDMSETDRRQSTNTRVQYLSASVDKAAIEPEEMRNVLIEHEDDFQDLEVRKVPTQEELEQRKQEEMEMMMQPLGGDPDAGVPQGQEGQEEKGQGNGGQESKSDPKDDDPDPEGGASSVEQDDDEDEEEGKKKGRGRSGDEEIGVGSVGDVSRNRYLDDIEPTEGLENEVVNGLTSRVVNPVLTRLTNRVRERHGHLIDRLPGTGEVRLKAVQRTRLFATYHSRSLVAKFQETRLKAIGINQYRWRDQRDDRVRPTHRRNHGKIFYFRDPPADTGNPGDDHNCFPGSVSILPAGLEASVAYRYVGKLIKISLADGVDLTVSPNHPILTQTGWKRAGDIDESDKLIQHCGGGGFFSGGGDPEFSETKSSAEQLHRLNGGSVDESGFRETDLHGDPAIRNEKIDIVSVPGKLRRRYDALDFKVFGDFQLKRADVTLPNLTNTGSFSFAGRGETFVSDGSVGGVGESLSFLEGGVGHTDSVGFAPSPDSEAEIFQAGLNNMPADSQVGRHLVDRLLAFPSFLDGSMESTPSFKMVSVTGVDVIDHDGLLYNFETSTGLIIANGIVTHNCRCKAEPVVTRQLVERLRRRPVLPREPIGIQNRIMQRRGIRTGSRAALVGVATALMVDRWHKDRMRQQFRQEIGAEIGGRIENRRIERTIGVQAQDTADSIGNLLAAISSDLAFLLVGAMAISEDTEVTEAQVQELYRLREELEILQREGQLYDEQIDQQFDLLFRIRQLEAMGAE